MKHIIMIIGFSLLFPLILFTGPTDAFATNQEKAISESEVEFENELRRLWFDHVLWTSNYITSATTESAADQKQVLSRLLNNQADIGNAIKPYYGEEAGHKLTELLKAHILIAGKIVGAAKNGQEDKVNQLNEEWYENTEEIAIFLSEANPNLKKGDLEDFLFKHLELVTNDLTASLDKDWEARIAAIDEGVSHIIDMSDAITSAIVKQFPEKFEK